MRARAAAAGSRDILDLDEERAGGSDALELV
jgi:hypothetical protein